MTRCYEPAPEPRPLLLRPLGWAGGLTPLALLLVSALAGPTILGVIVVLVELGVL